jgi:hypothetical protein
LGIEKGNIIYLKMECRCYIEINNHNLVTIISGSSESSSSSFASECLEGADCRWEETITGEFSRFIFDAINFEVPGSERWLIEWSN